MEKLASQEIAPATSLTRRIKKPERSAAFINEFANSHFQIVERVAPPPAKPTIPSLSAEFTSTPVTGSDLLIPGGYFKGIRSDELLDRLDFASLMLALFCGTAALPHILIRYYTVKDASAARKSTVVGICAIGFFYILTLYIGLGAMVSGNLDPTDSNMAAPLLAKTFGELPFAIISAIAFTTVLGTVSGLILAAAGAVAHDLVSPFSTKG
jgi:cation/acetate symporter